MPIRRRAVRVRPRSLSFRGPPEYPRLNSLKLALIVDPQMLRPEAARGEFEALRAKVWLMVRTAAPNSTPIDSCGWIPSPSGSVLKLGAGVPSKGVAELCETQEQGQTDASRSRQRRHPPLHLCLIPEGVRLLRDSPGGHRVRSARALRAAHHAVVRRGSLVLAPRRCRRGLALRRGAAVYLHMVLLPCRRATLTPRCPPWRRSSHTVVLNG